MSTFARYSVTGAAIDNGAWLLIPVQLTSAPAPTLTPGSEFTLSFRRSRGIDSVAAGFGLTGGGAEGSVSLQVDSSVVALKSDLGGQNPASHANTHAAGASDPLTPAAIGAAPSANPVFTGQVSVPAGTGASSMYRPGVAFALDSDTGIQQLAGANTLSLVSNGLERVRVREDGNVGVGYTGAATHRLGVSGAISGAGTNIVVLAAGTAQPEVSQVHGFFSQPGTAPTASLSSLLHYIAVGSAFPGPVVTQIGYQADSTMVHASFNYGFVGNIPSGPNRWNCFMAGGADNYFAGNVGVGVQYPAYKLHVSGAIAAPPGNRVAPSYIFSGSPTSGIFSPAANAIAISTSEVERLRVRSSGGIGIGSAGADNWAIYVQREVAQAGGSIAVLPSVTASATTVYGTFSRVGVSAGANVGTLYHHFVTDDQSVRVGSVQTQVGFHASSAFTLAAYTYGFRSDIPRGPNRWGFYAHGNADNYFAGNVGIATTTPSYALDVNGVLRAGSLTDGTTTKTMTEVLALGSAKSLGELQDVRPSSTDAPWQHNAPLAYQSTGAGAPQWRSLENSGDLLVPSNFRDLQYDANSLGHHIKSSAPLSSPVFSGVVGIGTGSGGAGSYAPGLAFSSDVGTGVQQIGGAGRLSLVAAGHEALRVNSHGGVGIGYAGSANHRLGVSGPIAGTGANMIALLAGTAQPAVTLLYGALSQPALASGAALEKVNHFVASQGVYAGSVAEQSGFVADSSLLSANLNYGFRGTINAGTGRWNCYMSGTADNFFQGKVGIGTATPSAKLDVAGTIAAQGGNASGPGLAFGPGTGVYSLSGGVSLATNGAQRVTVDSTGRMLVAATTSADAFTTQISCGEAGRGLDIRGRASDGMSQIQFSFSGGGLVSRIVASSTLLSLRAPAGGAVSLDSAAGSQVLAATDSGNVGIGISQLSAISAKLHVNGTLRATSITDGVTTKTVTELLAPPAAPAGRATHVDQKLTVTGSTAGTDGALYWDDDYIYLRTSGGWKRARLYGLTESPPTGSGVSQVQLTQAQYNALPTKDPDTLYIIVG